MASHAEERYFFVTRARKQYHNLQGFGLGFKTLLYLEILFILSLGDIKYKSNNKPIVVSRLGLARQSRIDQYNI